MLAAVALLGALIGLDQDKVEYKFVDDAVQVTVGGEPFATVNYKDVARPFIYPLYGPGGVQVLRNYPMVEGVEGEEYDHPHHTGVWFGHGDISGADVWHQEGRIAPRKNRPTSARGVDLVPGALMMNLDLIDKEERKLGTSYQLYSFDELLDGTRVVDIYVSLGPVDGRALTFGDTKEGVMGVRTHPNLRLSRSDGGPTGHVLNSEGIDDKSVWGKRAKWIDYWGEIEGETVGIAMFDHPDNPRHPTWWHAREYGLFAANPFGISAFEGKPAGAGDMELEADESVTFKYRIVLHRGSAQDAAIGELYRSWANGK